MLQDPCVVVLEPVGYKHRLSVRRLDQVFQHFQLPLMDQGISSETLLLRAEHLSVAASHSVTAFIQQVQSVPLSHGYVAANGDGVGVVDKIGRAHV